MSWSSVTSGDACFILIKNLGRTFLTTSFVSCEEIHKKPTWVNGWGFLQPMHLQVVSKRRQTLHYFMVVASGRADRVLARPLFCRLHMRMRTLNACGVVCPRTSKPSRLGKWLPIIVQISLTKKTRCIRVLVILVFSMAIPYCNNPHAACRHAHAAKFICGIWNH